MSSVQFASFGNVLRQHRVAAGLSQEELAERARMSVNGISALERGIRRSPQKETFSLLVSALGLSGESLRMLADAARKSQDGTPRPPEATAQLAIASNNLPVFTTPFFGRRAEIDEIVELLKVHRAITLAGSGGIGKTRTTVEVAQRVADLYRDGVWFVELAPVLHGANVMSTVAHVLRIEAGGDPNDASDLVKALSGKNALIVVDNCEHVIDAASAVVSQILRGCPGVAVLASSRQPLRVAGERTYRLPSLSVPQSSIEARLTGRAAADYAAIELFVDRAQAADSRFLLTDENVTNVATLCRRLDGIALAIELAAARTNMLTVTQLLGRLDERLRLLTGGNRDALPRQQTLRAAIDWSYELLDEPERMLFRRLGIFSGSFTIDGATAVGNADDFEGADLLDRLASIVDKSLIVTAFGSDAARYRLLESTRAYAFEKLEASGERDDTAMRHLAYLNALFAKLDEQGDLEGLGVEDALARELEEVRAALGFAEESRSAVGASLLAAVKTAPWHALNLGDEMASHSQTHLPLAPNSYYRESAMLNLILGNYYSNRRDREKATFFGAEGMIAARLSDVPTLTEALVRYAWIMADLDVDTAYSALQEALTYPPLSGRATAIVLDARMLVYLHRGEHHKIIEELELYFDGEYTDAAMLTQTLRMRLAEAYVANGDSMRAIDILERLLHGGRGGSWWGDALLYDELAGSYLLLDRNEEALNAARQSLELTVATGYRVTNAYALEAVALLIARRGEFRRAAIIAACADGAMRFASPGRSRSHRRVHELLQTLLDDSLGEEALAETQSQATALTVQTATVLALRSL